MEAFPNYYGISGVPRYTKWDGIRQAYLRKARRHHPDPHLGDPKAGPRMSVINGGLRHPVGSGPPCRVRRAPRQDYSFLGGREAHCRKGLATRTLNGGDFGISNLQSSVRFWAMTDFAKHITREIKDILDPDRAGHVPSSGVRVRHPVNVV